MRSGYEISKRIFDLAAAAAGLVLLSPLMAVLYLLARRSSRGRGLYVQDRVGRGGKPFPMYKFRTMRADHVHDPDPSIVIKPDHDAVTPAGRLLRKYKLDELPQVFNVLVGHMSLVGPRPTLSEQVAEYDDFRRRRLEAAPGITGLAQINGDTALTWDERIEWDVWYVDHRTFWMDLKILVGTFAVLARGTERHVRRLAQVHPEAPRCPAPAAGDRPDAGP